MKLMDRQTLSIMKACEAVGVSRRTIYNWISAGKVEYVRTAGGSIRIFADSLWRDPNARPAAARSVGDAATTGQNAQSHRRQKPRERWKPPSTAHTSPRSFINSKNNWETCER